ncbi:hypothetical protein HBB04_04314 [Pseudomonas coronafaciens]|nr:hypothetical protein HBB04_04314 [Pseudomonas coronafaciens]
MFPPMADPNLKITATEFERLVTLVDRMMGRSYRRSYRVR